MNIVRCITIELCFMETYGICFCWLQGLSPGEWNNNLEAVASRMRDKKVPVRRETAAQLMAVYRCTSCTRYINYEP